MGTAGFIGFVVDGTEKIAYNHWDSYPEGLGKDVLKWLRHVHLGGARRLAGELRVVGSGSAPTAEDVERLRDYADLGVGSQSIDDWYVLLRRTQGNPAAMLDAGVIEDASEFPADSLYAEWGYIIDFDAQSFEVYKGFQKEPHTGERFSNRTMPERAGGLSATYYPVRCVATWPLSKLPTDDEFVTVADPGDEDDS